MSAEISE